MRKITVVPYQVEWKDLYKEEAEQLRSIYQSEMIDIHHIGSTAVEGLQAKPIIDLMPVVKDIEKIDPFNEAMKQLGYQAKGENGIDGRRHFQKGGDQRTHHVHIFEQSNPEIERHLAFRDYLRAHPAVAQKYGELKAGLAQQYPYEIASYAQGKAKLITETLEKALLWQKQRTK